MVRIVNALRSRHVYCAASQVAREDPPPRVATAGTSGSYRGAPSVPPAANAAPSNPWGSNANVTNPKIVTHQKKKRKTKEIPVAVTPRCIRAVSPVMLSQPSYASPTRPDNSIPKNQSVRRLQSLRVFGGRSCGLPRFGTRSSRPWRWSRNERKKPGPGIRVRGVPTH